jgi:hypothetical protein
MECPRCHYANTDGARFCGECGASLTRDVTCSSCGHANPAGQTFCNGCGHRLDESARSAARDRPAYTQCGAFEFFPVTLALFQGDQFVGGELFELEDLDAARTRFEELRPKTSP